MERRITWKEAPMARLLVPLLAGIVPGIFFWEKGADIPLWGMAIGVAGCLPLTRKRIPYRLRYAYAVVCICFWTSAGFWLASRSLDFSRADYFMNMQVDNPVWVGTVVDKRIVEIEGFLEQEGAFVPVRGRVLAYSDAPLAKGQKLLFQAAFQDIPGAKNPGGFDNRRYRFFQNIHTQTYLAAEQYVAVGQEEPGILERWRNRQLEIWKERISDEEVFSIAAAMVLGYKDELSRELRATYAQTGASHVLAVSGLHVGLIYLFLSNLLGRMRQGRYLRALNTLLCIGGIWGFALLTGAAPSVMRASTMFSFMLVGKQLGWRISIYNSLAASAFFLLCINPLWLFHIGFQLSYLAVLGIVIFQPLWYRLWIPDNRWLDKIWALVAVSLAAQLATLPLTLFYFHQFPTYFWLSGLVVVPAAPFIIGLGIAMTIAEYVAPGFAWIPALLLRELIGAINKILLGIQQLPFSLWEDVYFPDEAILLSFAALYWLARMWEKAEWKNAIHFLILLNVIAGLRFYYEARYFCREELVVYQVNGETLIDIIHKGYALTWRSPELIGEEEERAAGVHRRRRRIYRQEIHETRSGMMEWVGFRVMIISPGGGTPVFPDADFVVLSGNPDISFADMRKEQRTFIADASNWKKRAASWREEAGENLVDIRETGPFVSVRSRAIVHWPALLSGKSPISD
jgi:competence protein ComEC